MRLIPLLILLNVFCALRGAERVALVIGNSSYPGDGLLPNPVNDARAVSVLLKDAGFELVTVENAVTDKFYEALEEMKKQASGASLCLFYFAGHGVEVDGKNYLLPVNAVLESAAQLRTQAVALDDVLADLAGARCGAGLVILDCCRNNPLRTRGWLRTRSPAGGLKALGDTGFPPSTMVMFSAGPGQQALDGTGANSPFTMALVGRLRQPGLSLFDAFLGTSDDVAKATGNKQEPWVKFDGAGRVFRELSFLTREMAPSRPAVAATMNATTPPRPADMPRPFPAGPAYAPAPAPPLPASSPAKPAGDPELDKQDAMRGVREVDRAGMLLTTGVFLRNAGRSALQYQFLTESGWQTRTLGGGAEKVVLLTHGGGIRVKQGGRFRRVPMTGYTQPHYEFADPNLANIERMARTRPNVLRTLPNGDVELD